MAIKVLIIDDSALVRQLLTSILDADPGIEVVGTATDPIFGLNKVDKLDPDVITCDVEMPRMDGLTFLKKLMAESPKPVVMISSYTAKNCQTSLRALELGAVDVVQKPGGNLKDGIQELSSRVITAVKIAARARVRFDKTSSTKPRSEEELSTPKSSTPAPVTSELVAGKKHFIDELIPLVKYKPGSNAKVIAIGASTGGTVAIGEVLEKLPPTLPGIVLVQHIPADFTPLLAERLNSICSINVREARNRDRVERGTALIAPGDSHMLLGKDSMGYFVTLMDAFPINRHKPSVDVLFRTVANIAGPLAIGVILTGMNDDGARAMKNMHDNGAYNIAQDEASCVVFGMPKNAIEMGAVNIVAPLDQIPDIIVKRARII
jgi:two-component system chemotaxis response regulator CheB